ncbi:DMT family transporter, partial [Devosia sp. 66-14]
MKLQYWLLIILLGAVWGCSFLFNAILIREISPLWVSAGRVSIGAAICWLVFFATRKKLPTDPRLYGQFLILGILNYAIPFALFPFAEQTVASSIVGVINGMTPMTTVIVSQLWPGGEKATWNKVVGVGVGFLGAVILALPSLGVGASAQIIGLLAAFIATLC